VPAPLTPPQELARSIKDPAEAARWLASCGDYLEAAQRCLADEAFINRASLAQLLQLHAWLLRVGTVDAARQAVQLWDGQAALGRLQADIIEAQAAAQLALGRALLRQVAGVATPTITLGGGSDASGGQGKQGHGQKQKGKASYAKAAASSVNAPKLAQLPTASVRALHLVLAQNPDREDLQDSVSEAARTLADAQQGFLTAKQHAGVVEALSWGLAAKPQEAITVAQWQLEGGAGARGSMLCDALEAVGQTQQTVLLLKALASTVSDVKGECVCSSHQQSRGMHTTPDTQPDSKRHAGVAIR
jgi:hypothetical protein